MAEVATVVEIAEVSSSSTSGASGSSYSDSEVPASSVLTSSAGSVVSVSVTSGVVARDDIIVDRITRNWWSART